MFSVGQKVICINAEFRAETIPFLPLRPRVGGIYTVASIQVEPNIDGRGLRLQELPNPSIVWNDGSESEWSFDSGKFRLLDEPPEHRLAALASAPAADGER